MLLSDEGNQSLLTFLIVFLAKFLEILSKCEFEMNISFSLLDVTTAHFHTTFERLKISLFGVKFQSRLNLGHCRSKAERNALSWLDVQ